MKKKLYITLERDNKGINIYLKIPQEFEDYFSELSKGEIKISNCWKYSNGEGAKFYTLTDEYQEMERKFTYNSFNSYGDGLIKDEKINLAMLRSVGASQGISIYSNKFLPIDNMDFERYIRELGSYAKKIWESFISKKKLKAIITFEL